MYTSDSHQGIAFSGFDHLHSALIDTSSVIYITKAGYFLDLAQTIKLYTIPEVIGELGTPEPSIEVLTSSEECTTTDQKLLHCAIKKNKPVISEDSRILKMMKLRGITYYNALSILIFLHYRDILSIDEFMEKKRALEKIARYSPWVWRYGEVLLSAVRNRKQRY